MMIRTCNRDIGPCKLQLLPSPLIRINEGFENRIT